MIVESGLRLGPGGEIVPAYQGDPQARQCPTEIHCTREVVAVSGAFFVVSTHGLEQLGGKCVRAMTLARTELAILLQCAAYNAKRLVWLLRHDPCGCAR